MVIIVMGVSGCGKSTVGRLLASRLSLPFKDADNFHPLCNVEKMQPGFPLNDEDRKPWLQKLNKNIRKWNNEGGTVLACFALKKFYRILLKKNFHPSKIIFVFLYGTKK